MVTAKIGTHKSCDVIKRYPKLYRIGRLKSGDGLMAVVGEGLEDGRSGVEEVDILQVMLFLL